MEGQRNMWYIILQQVFSAVLANHYSLESSWGLLAYSLGASLESLGLLVLVLGTRDESVAQISNHLCAPFEIPSVARVWQSWREELCPARRALEPQESIVLPAVGAEGIRSRGSSREAPQCLRLDRSVKISICSIGIWGLIHWYIYSVCSPKQWKLVSPVFHQNWDPTRKFVMRNKCFILNCFTRIFFSPEPELKCKHQNANWRKCYLRSLHLVCVTWAYFA